MKTAESCHVLDRVLEKFNAYCKDREIDLSIASFSVASNMVKEARLRQITHDQQNLIRIINEVMEEEC